MKLKKLILAFLSGLTCSSTIVYAQGSNLLDQDQWVLSCKDLEVIEVPPENNAIISNVGSIFIAYNSKYSPPYRSRYVFSTTAGDEYTGFGQFNWNQVAKREGWSEYLGDVGENQVGFYLPHPAVLKPANTPESLIALQKIQNTTDFKEILRQSWIAFDFDFKTFQGEIDRTSGSLFLFLSERVVDGFSERKVETYADENGHIRYRNTGGLSYKNLKTKAVYRNCLPVTDEAQIRGLNIPWEPQVKF